MRRVVIELILVWRVVAVYPLDRRTSRVVGIPKGIDSQLTSAVAVLRVIGSRVAVDVSLIDRAESYSVARLIVVVANGSSGVVVGCVEDKRLVELPWSTAGVVVVAPVSAKGVGERNSRDAALLDHARIIVVVVI